MLFMKTCFIKEIEGIIPRQAAEKEAEKPESRV